MGFAMRRLEDPAVNGYLFRIREGKGSEMRGMGSAFHQLCPRYSGTLLPTAPTAIRLWVTLTVTRTLSYGVDKNDFQQA